MKRYGGLWEQVVAWENLLLAARKARKGTVDARGVCYWRSRPLVFSLVPRSQEWYGWAKYTHPERDFGVTP